MSKRPMMWLLAALSIAAAYVSAWGSPWHLPACFICGLWAGSLIWRAAR